MVISRISSSTKHKDDGEAAIAEWLKANPDAYEGEITDEDK